MFDFIPIIRNERRKENNYKKLGVEFIEENHYMLIDEYMFRNDDIFTFEVRANFKDQVLYNKE